MIDFRKLKKGDRVKWFIGDVPETPRNDYFTGIVKEVHSDHAIVEPDDLARVRLWLDDDTAVNYEREEKYA